jgi:hypothetical protein
MPRFKHNTTNQTAVMLMLALSGLLLGCESTPTAVERNFGASVRNMIEQQTAQPGYQGAGMDGQKSQALWRSYRGDVADPKQVDQRIIQIQMSQ